MHNEDWKHDQAPTTEDLKKFRATKAKLLVALDYYAHPFETFIGEITPDGDYCQVGISGGPFNQPAWVPRQDIRIVALLDKPQPIPREIPRALSVGGFYTVEQVRSEILSCWAAGAANITRAPEVNCEPEPKKSYWQRLIDKIKR